MAGIRPLADHGIHGSEEQRACAESSKPGGSCGSHGGWAPHKKRTWMINVNICILCIYEYLPCTICSTVQIKCFGTCSRVADAKGNWLGTASCYRRWRTQHFRLPRASQLTLERCREPWMSSLKELARTPPRRVHLVRSLEVSSRASSVPTSSHVFFIIFPLKPTYALCIDMHWYALCNRLKLWLQAAVPESFLLLPTLCEMRGAGVCECSTVCDRRTLC